MEFKKSSVEELIEKNVIEKPMDGNHGSIHPKSQDFTDVGIPFITAADINSDKVDIEKSNKLSQRNAQKLKKGFAKQGDVLLTHKASVGRTAIVHNTGYDYIILSPQVTYYRIKDNTTLLPEYLYLYFKSKYFNQTINQWAGGSTRNYIGITAQRKLPIIYPSIKNQKKIIDIIMTFEYKVQTNEKIIANLEELSQTLFKRWFVDFEFPDENGNPYKSSDGEMIDSELGEIPKRWTVKNLDDIANYVNGLAMQKFKPTDNQNSLPVVKIKELKNGSTDENSNRCNSEIPEKALIVDGDIIFSWSATLLVKMWCGGKAGLNQHLFKVSSDKYPKWFYYYWTKRYIDYFIGIANDKATTMGHINRKHLSHAKILIPNDQTLERFSRTFDDLLEKELSVSKESKRLTELRDTLLPKLMSGEIEIPTDIEVNEDELSI